MYFRQYRIAPKPKSVSPKKRILHVSPFDDIKLLGISTTLKDYKLAFFMNAAIKLDLRRMSDFIMPAIPEVSFSFFYFDEGENQNVYNLIQAKKEGFRLLPPRLPMDFLLLIRNAVLEERLDFITAAIKQINEVMTVYELDVDKHREVDVLLEQLEFHEFKLMKEGQLKRNL